MSKNKISRRQKNIALLLGEQRRLSGCRLRAHKKYAKQAK